LAGTVVPRPEAACLQGFFVFLDRARLGSMTSGEGV
jgi:hypothetical protein